MIDADAVGELVDGADQFVAAREHAVGGAEIPRPLQLLRHDVGGDDRRRATQPSPLHDVHAVAAAADHENAIARLHPCAVARGADAGRNAARHQAGVVERNVIVDHDDGCLIDDGAFGESADHAEGADISAIGVAPPIAAIELRPWVMRGPSAHK